MAKLPDPDPAVIASKGAVVAVVQRHLWRLHTPAGRHPARWDHLRTYGPIASARYDPWVPPPKDRTADPVTAAVGYFGFDIPTCLAEVFQTTRHISTDRGGIQLTAFMPTRQLRLLDLRDSWPIAIGASHAINSGPKNRCRAWAHAIRSVHSGYDGFLYTGLAGRGCVVLYSPPGDLFPAVPDFTKPLADPGLAPYVADAAERIGYALD
jgi:hypothetical protein